MPWKNGLGTTRQLAIHPPSASLDAFEWRVSIAQLRGTTAFSIFEGVERCLAMLQGEMTLLRADAEPVRLTTASQPVSFAGNVSMEGRVESDAALDLNLMYRAAQWNGTMRRMTLAAAHTRTTEAMTLLCTLRAGSVDADGTRYELDPFDLLRAEVDTELRAVTAIDGYMMELRARQP